MFKQVSETRLFAGFCLGLAVLSGVFLATLMISASTQDNKSYTLGQGFLRLPAMGLSFVGMCAGLGEIVFGALAKRRISIVTILATIVNATVFAFSVAWDRA